MQGCEAKGCEVLGCAVLGCEVVGCEVLGCEVLGCEVQGCEVQGCEVVGCEVLGCEVVGCEVLDASPKRRPGWDFPPRRRKTASDAAAPQSTSLAHCLRHARLKTAVAAAHDAIMPSVAIFHK